MLNEFLRGLFRNAMALNRENILELVAGHGGVLLDLGCDDGEWTSEVASAAKAGKILGLELIEERAALARKRGIEVRIANLEKRWPVDDASVDIVHANQVIEHVADVDHFAAELQRVLKPGGVAVVSTENGSSWHNVAAASLGWQQFSLSNVSSKRSGIGNPAALHRGEVHAYSTWTHKVIFNYLGLIEFFEVHGFEKPRVLGSGYYPLPARVGVWDPRHAHFLAIACTKRAA